LHGEVDVQLSPFGLLLLTQPLHSSEQHTKANLEFSSNFELFHHQFYAPLHKTLIKFKKYIILTSIDIFAAF
jgi:hypothetical protein